MDIEEKQLKKHHDAFFRWLFADTNHLRYLLELAGKVNVDIGEFLTAVNLDTLVRIPDSYSEVYETGDADLAFALSGQFFVVGNDNERDALLFIQIKE